MDQKTEGRVFVLRVLCPCNHVILMLAGWMLDTAGIAATLKARFERALADDILRADCSICDSPNVRVEIERTPYRSLEAAESYLTRIAHRQKATGKLWQERN